MALLRDEFSSSIWSLTSQAASSQRTDNGRHAYTFLGASEDSANDQPTTENSFHGEEQKSMTTEHHAEHVVSAVPSQDHRRHPRLFENWWQEITAGILSLATLLALMVTLYVYVDKPSPEWPAWISINTIISLYIVVLKAGVIFVTANGLGQLKWMWFSGPQARQLSDLVFYDDASRGPRGAVFLLWQVRFCRLVPSLGALVTLLALAADPFAQQIIHYYDCSIPTAQGIATLPRTNYYVELQGVHTGAESENIVPGVVDAINAGLYSPTPTPSAAQCTTGNCTWTEEYSSVGWCSSCYDITDELAFKMTSVDRINAENDTATSWTLITSLPSGVEVKIPECCGGYWQLETLWEFASMGTSLYGSHEFILGKLPDGAVNPTTLRPWPGCNTTSSKQTLWTCKGYGASRCSLYPCVKTYTASTTLGVLTESVVNTASSFGFSIYPGNLYATLDTACVTAQDRKRLQEEGYNLQNGERWLAYNLTDGHDWFNPPLSDTFPTSMMKQGCIYMVDGTFDMSIGAYFDNFLNGTVTGDPLNQEESTLGDFDGPQIVQTVYNFGNVTFESVQEIFANVSTALTNYMRANGADDYSANAVGTVFQDKTCIAVQWPWLALPGVLVLLTFLFLLLIVLQSPAMGDAPEVWKNSPLPLLFHSFSNDSGTCTGRSGQSIDDMEKLARKTKVKLINDGSNNLRWESQHVDRMDN